MNRRSAAAIARTIWLALAPIGALTAGAAVPDQLPLTAASRWVVDQTTELPGLLIPEGATIAAPAGRSLTMTVDGVDVPIAPGSYRGKVVLTPTDDITVKSASVAPHRFRTALYVDNGKLVRNKSVTSALVGGVVTDSSATNVAITSREEDFNGIVVTGDSRYVITNPRIELTGNGGDDTDGFGAGILSSGTADVVVNGARITTRGAIRSAIYVAGASTMHVNNASIEVFNGTLPADYQFNIGDGRVMMEVPWMLGLSGNVRATNAVENGTVYYNHSHIRAQGWGALSTDGVRVVRMYVKDSVIEAVDSGYGAYALGDSIDTFRHCSFDVADYGLIIGGNGSGIFSDGTRVRSRRFGVMLHQGGGGTLTIDKGSVFNTQSTLIQVKGRGTDIIIDHARLQAGNGILLQTMDNDDPFMKAMVARGSIAPGAGMGPGPAKGNPRNNVTATLSNVRLTGDFIHAMSDLGELTVVLGHHALINGAITTATATPSTGKDPTRATYKLIGDVQNKYGPATGTHGLTVLLEGGSEWTINKTSYLNALTIGEGAALRAPRNRTLTLFVNGTEAPINPGSYAGQIVLQVSPAAN